MLMEVYYRNKVYPNCSSVVLVMTDCGNMWVVETNLPSPED